jgi:hypothetical protein
MTATTIARIAAYGLIPTVMAILGFHLAALAVADDRKRKLWRAAFIILAVLGMGIAALVEIRADAEHRGEVAGYSDKTDYNRRRTRRAKKTKL